MPIWSPTTSVEICVASVADSCLIVTPYPRGSKKKGSPSSAIRQGGHKLTLLFKIGRRELYDLDEDIGEKEGLAGRMPELADIVHDELKSWWKEVDARFPKGFIAD